MGKIHDIFSSRNGSTTLSLETHVGNLGRIFYDEDTGNLRLSDGVTPGGLPVPITIATNSQTGAVLPGQGLEVIDVNGTIRTKIDSNSFQFNINNAISLKPATETTLGGIKIGPGVTLNASNQLIIDSEGLDFSFGDFSATSEAGVDSAVSAVLSSINENEPIIIRANGTGSVSIVGGFNVFPTDGSLGDRDPVFNVNALGEITATTLDITNPGVTDTMAPLNVSINEQGLTKTPAVIAGVIAQFTGRDNLLSSMVLDSYGVDPTYGPGGNFVFRTGLGTNQTPTAVQSNTILGRIETAGWANNGYGGIASTSLRFVANENFTSTDRSGRMEFWAVPTDSTLIEKLITFDETGITLDKTEIGVSNASFVTFDITHINDHTDEGTLCWSSTDKTLNLHHQNDVVQQIGQETYALCLNNTGSTIVNGSVVRFDGSDVDNGEVRLEVAPFQANGVYPTLYGLGVATESISDGAAGFITVWGKVRGLNTTGATVGETWALGDILYASPATAGAFTKVKPTAPNNVLPVAAVLKVDSVAGEIFVRPTVEQKMSYGRFLTTVDQTIAAINTAYTVSFNTTQTANGVSIGSPTSHLVVDQSGLYQISIAAQVATASNSADLFYMWIRKNGVDVPNSMARTTVDATQNPFITLSFTHDISLAATDYIQIAYAGQNTAIYLDSSAATAFGPAAAGCSVNITQVQL